MTDYPKHVWILVILLLASILAGCDNDTDTTVSDDFESGSIGRIIRNSDIDWELYLADDNDAVGLPDRWRNWWYVKVRNAISHTQTKITLKNRGWPYYYLPVYSYDQVKWYRFSEDEVTQNDDSELIMVKQFDYETVWIARFYPYTLTDLEDYLSSLSGNPYIDMQTPGYSQNGNPLYALKITDFSIPGADKERIFMHARTHPGETPVSFLVEGIINFLLTDTQEVSDILSAFEFYIFPMHNVDGVIEGNYRSTPQTENLEVMWYYFEDSPLNLTADVPQEVAVVHEYAKNLMSDGGPPVSIALNLHASNSEPEIRPFFFPHFGPESMGYTTIEASLWDKQITFINSLATNYGTDMLEPLPEEGGRYFTTTTYPESWWWVNYQDEVMAITMEMTYGMAGYSPEWIKPDDLRDIGTSLVLGIRDYYDDSVPVVSSPKARKGVQNRNLRYPEYYPPNAIDELKE